MYLFILYIYIYIYIERERERENNISLYSFYIYSCLFICASIFKYSVRMQEERSRVLNGRASSPNRQAKRTMMTERFLGW